jgi:ATP-dependent exoDNAse (exonuclease V) beta subunit
MTAELVDAEARAAISSRLDENLFVEAGAGSGKTRSLVERVVALVRRGDSVQSIAAITFTEKAAEELRARVRRELELGVARGASACEAALIELDRAAIGTLHSFAQRLLQEAPIEAGLPPRIEVLDDIRSDVAFEVRWSSFRDRLLDEPALQRPLLLLIAAGGKLTQIRELARAANASWDQVAALIDAGQVDPGADAPPLDIAPVLAAARAVWERRAECLVSGDLLRGALDEMRDWIDQLERADELHALALLDRVPGKGRGGKGGNWAGGAETVDSVKAGFDGVKDAAKRAREEVVRATLAHLVAAIMRFTVAAAAERRSVGELEFHDLLVLARELLREAEHGPRVRARLRAKYQHLLLDEFQDTDPIQLEIAALLATTADGELRGRDWDALPLAPGSVFVVGDPKQSIYRFRRADIAMFLAAQQRLVPADGRLTLHANFRSSPDVVGFVNDVFARLIQAKPDAQPSYQPLDGVRPPSPADAGASVTLVGTEPHGAAWRADDVRRAEALDVVDAIRTARAEQWMVRDHTRAEGAETWRPIRLADMCVLIPARTSLAALEDALGDAGIAYRTETASLVYSTREVRDLVMVLRAIDDPTDEAALVAALRTSWLACGDDDLLEHRRAFGGRWNLRAPLPDALPAAHPVREAMSFLQELHRERQWATPSELLDRIVRERRVLELGFELARPRDLWRRIRFVIDQARAYEDATGGDLRDFLHWITLQSAEGARVVEAVLPETDDDAVRIMTIHAAKGLEFPMVILSGMSTEPRAPRGVQLLFPAGGGYDVKLSKSVTSEGYDEQVAIDEQMDHHERLRLLYVACTRAEDHLVVSVHRKEREPSSDAARTNAELVWKAASDLGSWTPLEPAPTAATADDAAPPRVEAPRVGGADADAAFAAWEAEHRALVDPVRAERVLSASGLARRAAEAAGALTHLLVDEDDRVEITIDDPALDKEPRDLELPP